MLGNRPLVLPVSGTRAPVAANCWTSGLSRSARSGNECALTSCSSLGTSSACGTLWRWIFFAPASFGARIQQQRKSRVVRRRVVIVELGERHAATCVRTALALRRSPAAPIVEATSTTALRSDPTGSRRKRASRICGSLKGPKQTTTHAAQLLSQKAKVKNTRNDSILAVKKIPNIPNWLLHMVCASPPSAAPVRLASRLRCHEPSRWLAARSRAACRRVVQPCGQQLDCVCSERVFRNADVGNRWRYPERVLVSADRDD